MRRSQDTDRFYRSRGWNGYIIETVETTQPSSTVPLARPFLWLLISVSFGAILGGCVEEAERPLVGTNVVLVVVDTLRADHLGHYGGSSRSSPCFDSLAEQAVTFEDVTSSSSHTVPSVISILSGRYPHRHGNQYYPATNSLRVPRTGARPRIPESIPLMAELFRDSGYATAAVVSNPWLRREFGFGDGFDEYRYLHGKSWTKHPDGRLVNEATRELLQGHLKGARFFLYLHYMDVHPPFRPPLKYRKSFTRGLRGQLLPVKNGLLENASDEDLLYTRAVYAAAVRGFDDRLRDLMGLLREAGVEESTLLVLVGDHGEEFSEHGGLGHGFNLYEEVTRVPLLFAHPALLPRRLRAPVAGIDLLPTILDLAGLATPRGLDGSSLATRVLGHAQGEPPAGRVLASELGGLTAIRSGDRKLLIGNEGGGDPEIRAFDLSTDAGETSPLAEAPWRDELVALGEQLLQRRIRVGDVSPAVPEPADFDARLRALGYVEQE